MTFHKKETKKIELVTRPASHVDLGIPPPPCFKKDMYDIGYGGVATPPQWQWCGGGIVGGYFFV